MESTGRLLPPGLVRWQRLAAFTVFVAEAVAALMIAVPATAMAGFGLAAALLVGFAAAIVSSLRRGETGPCHCFGASSAPLGPGHVVRNLLLAAVAIAGMAFSSRLSSTDGAHMRPGGVAITLVGAFAAALLLSRLDDVFDLFRSPAAPTGS